MAEERRQSDCSVVSKASYLRLFCNCVPIIMAPGYAYIWLNPGIFAARGNVNQPKINLLLHRQLSLNCNRSFFIESTLLISPEMLLIAILRSVGFEKI